MEPPGINFKKTFTRTRIAPTPSGYLHVGNILSFAITAAIAEQWGARIFLRIDDRDRDRMDQRHLEDIFETLTFLAIPWHEGPHSIDEHLGIYSQQTRLGLYNAALQQLREDGQVFACTCPRSRLTNTNGEGYSGICRNKNIPLDTPDACWRLYADAEHVAVKTLDKDVEEVLPAEMRDLVVRKKDGSATYQLTSVVDDIHFGIDLVVRGEDLWASTVAQHMLAKRLRKPEFDMITFHHHPLMLDGEGKKMSKSAGSTSVHHLRAAGYSAEGIYTLIAQWLGHSGRASNWSELAELVM
ncbi:MAG: glutamate--tRNA ligase family protein [Bacteroidota bacterium]